MIAAFLHARKAPFFFVLSTVSPHFLSFFSSNLLVFRCAYSTPSGPLARNLLTAFACCVVPLGSVRGRANRKRTHKSLAIRTREKQGSRVTSFPLFLFLSKPHNGRQVFITRRSSTIARPFGRSPWEKDPSHSCRVLAVLGHTPARPVFLTSFHDLREGKKQKKQKS